MLEINNYKYLLKDLSELKGVGKKTSTLLKKKKILTIFDLLWRLPRHLILTSCCLASFGRRPDVPKAGR